MTSYDTLWPPLRDTIRKLLVDESAVVSFVDAYSIVYTLCGRGWQARLLDDVCSECAAYLASRADQLVTVIAADDECFCAASRLCDAYNRTVTGMEQVLSYLERTHTTSIRTELMALLDTTFLRHHDLWHRLYNNVLALPRQVQQYRSAHHRLLMDHLLATANAIDPALAQTQPALFADHHVVLLCATNREPGAGEPEAVMETQMPIHVASLKRTLIATSDDDTAPIKRAMYIRRQQQQQQQQQ